MESGLELACLMDFLQKTLLKKDSPFLEMYGEHFQAVYFAIKRVAYDVVLG